MYETVKTMRDDRGNPFTVELIGDEMFLGADHNPCGGLIFTHAGALRVARVLIKAALQLRHTDERMT